MSKDVVLIGGGHTHALLLRAWGMRPIAGARLTLINPAPSAPYTGMLPGHIAGHYQRDDLEIDLVKLARFAGARLIFGTVVGLDRVQRRISIFQRPDIRYDIASFDIGITSSMPDLTGFSDHGVAAKPLGPFAQRWSEFLTQDDKREVVVLGAGVAGIELALAMKYRLDQTKRADRITIVETGRALTGVASKTRALLLNEIEKARIDIIEDTKATEISSSSVTLDTGEKLDAGLVVGAAGARPFDWLAETGLDLTDGFLTVDGSLRSTNDPSVYAAGDCAHLSHAPRPKAGVFAVRAAPVLAHNIRADLTGHARRRFQPQSSYLKLISLGRKSAVTDKWGLAYAGDWVWKWKDRIDRRFMDRLSDLPKMKHKGPKNAVTPTDNDFDAPLCGGCGAKVGGELLDAAIKRSLPDTGQFDAKGPGDDAAILEVENVRQVMSTDHLRAFWDDPYVMAKIAAVHALGDVWAMGAEPQAMLPQIILPKMSEAMQSAWLDEIMDAAQAVAEVSGARIVGGHTTLGAELTLGFTVTGLLTDAPLTLDGAEPGDAVLLTRPIGSGTILKAEMALGASGRDVAAALSLMSTPQGQSARVIAKFANAMTDVTGFGLAGHLLRMAVTSQLTAEIALEKIPFMPGAKELSTRGVRSSLYKANRRDAPIVVPTQAEVPLLFDPQTAGGFLAAIPEEAVARCLSELSEVGVTASVIGQFRPKDDAGVIVS